MKADTDIGPLATLAIRDELADQIERSLKGGAESLTKDRTVPKKGAWIAPQILAEAHSGTPSTDEEMFGPVANLWKVSSLGDAISRANRSMFGLGSVLFSKDESEIDQAIRAARSRCHIRQFHGRVRSASPLRGNQTIRLWARTCRRRPARLCEPEDRLGGVITPLRGAIPCRKRESAL
jgi:acyl-CoA reductase-like NAD-dependent aldehyde dehydrogenase